MKITVNTKEFTNAMERVFKVTATKSGIASIQNILLTADSNKSELYLSATNLEQFAKIKLNTYIDECASFTFSDTKALLKAMKFFTGHETTLEYTQNDVTVLCGGKKAKQATLNARDFPTFPSLDNEFTNNTNYNNKKLKERFTAINYAASNDDSRPTMTGISFKNSDMVACDGFRIALNKDEQLTVDTQFVVPCAALKHVNDVLGEQVLIKTDKKYIQFIDDVNGGMVISRLLEGDYLDYTKVFDVSRERGIEVDTKDYINGLKYLKTFVNVKQPISWRNNKIGLETTAGYFESEIKTQGSTEIEIAFNGDYMREALSQFKGEVKIYVDTDIKPMLITSEKDSNNIALVLPTRPGKKIFMETA